MPPGETRTGKKDRTRHLRLIWLLQRVQIMNEVQYRANFVLQVVRSAIALACSFAMLAILFDKVPDLNGWGPSQLLVLVGIFTFVGGLLRTFVQPNLMELVGDVHQGTLDFVLTKPVDAQLFTSVRSMRLWQAVDVIAGAGIIIWAATHFDQGVTVRDCVLFLISLLLGVVIIYSFLFSLMTTAFWFVRVDEAAELFETFYQAGRWPISIYPQWLRLVFTLVVPISSALTVPADAITSRLSWWALLGEIALAGALFAFTRWFFKAGLRRYSAASS
jgi:ABC-2 type transport system permease protein